MMGIVVRILPCSALQEKHTHTHTHHTKHMEVGEKLTGASLFNMRAPRMELRSLDLVASDLLTLSPDSMFCF